MDRFKGKKKQIILGHLVALLILMSYILPDVLMVAKSVTTIKTADMKKTLSRRSEEDEIRFEQRGPIEIDLANEYLYLFLENYENYDIWDSITSSLTGSGTVLKKYSVKNDDPSVAEVVEEAETYIKLKLKKEGKTYITVYYDDYDPFDSIEVRVKDSHKEEAEQEANQEIVSESVSLYKKNVVLRVGQIVPVNFDANVRVMPWFINPNQKCADVEVIQDNVGYSGQKKHVNVLGKQVGQTRLVLVSANGTSDYVDITVIKAGNNGQASSTEPGQQSNNQQQSSNQQQSNNQQQQQEYIPEPQAMINPDSTGDIYLKPGENHEIHLLNVDRWENAVIDNNSVIDGFNFDPNNYTHLGIWAQSDIKYNTWTQLHLLNYGNRDWSGGNYHWMVYVQAEPIIEQRNDIHLYVGEELTLMENGDKTNYGFMDSTNGAVSYQVGDGTTHPITIKADKVGTGRLKVEGYGNSKWGYGYTKTYNIIVTERPVINYTQNTIKLVRGETATAVFKPANYRTITLNTDNNHALVNNTDEGYVKDANGNITGLKITGNTTGKTTIKATITDDWGKTAVVTYNVEVYEPLTVTSITPKNLVQDSEGNYWGTEKDLVFRVQFNQKVSELSKSNILNYYNGTSVGTVTNIERKNDATFDVTVTLKDSITFRNGVQFNVISPITIYGTNIMLSDSASFTYNIDTEGPKVTSVKPYISTENLNDIVVEFTVKDNNKMKVEDGVDYRYVNPTGITADIRELKFLIDGSAISNIDFEALSKTEEKFTYKATLHLADLESKRDSDLTFKLLPDFNESVKDIAGNRTERFEKSYNIGYLLDSYQNAGNEGEAKEYKYLFDDQDDVDTIKPDISLTRFTKKYIKENGKVYVILTSQLAVTDENYLDPEAPGLVNNSNVIALKKAPATISLDANLTTVEEVMTTSKMRVFLVTTKIELDSNGFTEWTYDLNLNSVNGACADVAGNRFDADSLSELIDDENDLVISSEDREFIETVASEGDTQDTQKPTISAYNTTKKITELGGKYYISFITNVVVNDETEIKADAANIDSSNLTIEFSKEVGNYQSRITNKTIEGSTKERAYTITTIAEITIEMLEAGDLYYSFEIDSSGNNACEDTAGNVFDKLTKANTASISKTELETFKNTDNVRPEITMNSITKEIKEDTNGKYAEVVANFTISDDRAMDTNLEALIRDRDIMIYRYTYDSDNEFKDCAPAVFSISEPEWDMENSKHPCTYTVTITDRNIEDEDTIEYEISITPKYIKDTSGNIPNDYLLRSSKDYTKYIRQVQVVNKEVEIDVESDANAGWQKSHYVIVDLMDSEDENYVDESYSFKWVNAENNKVVESGKALLGDRITKGNLNGLYNFVYEVNSSTAEGKLTGIVGPFKFDNEVSEAEKAKLVFKEVGTNNNVFNENDIVEDEETRSAINAILGNTGISIAKAYKTSYTNKDINVSIVNGNGTENGSGFKQAGFIVDIESLLNGEDFVASTNLTEDRKYFIILGTEDNCGNKLYELYVVDKEEITQSEEGESKISSTNNEGGSQGENNQGGNETGTEGELSEEEKKLIEEMEKELAEKQQIEKAKETAQETSKKMGEINKAGMEYFMVPAIIGLVAIAVISIKKYRNL
ncbi:MAG: hypothetical protein IJJ82_02065 [Clostridia bacterium]|nr:hypothetical protein [Clostridia bacterium]